ncbi:hypothetical protein ACSSNL_18110 [Thalassobius sp. S69A]
MEVVIALIGVFAIVFLEAYWRQARIKRDKKVMRDFRRHIYGDEDD